jgi:hypothetical protein
VTPPDERETIPPPRLDAGEATAQAGRLIYQDERVRYVHATTGLDEGTVRAVLRSRDRYNLGLGVYPAELAQEGETPEGIRAEHPQPVPDAPHRVALRRRSPRAAVRRDRFGDCSHGRPRDLGPCWLLRGSAQTSPAARMRQAALRYS